MKQVGGNEGLCMTRRLEMCTVMDVEICLRLRCAGHVVRIVCVEDLGGDTSCKTGEQ
jgi:hypothetical protein